MEPVHTPLKTGAISLSAGAVAGAISWVVNLVFHVPMPGSVSIVFAAGVLYGAHQLALYVANTKPQPQKVVPAPVNGGEPHA